MTVINYRERDITTIKKGMIMHGVNCRGKMGSGIAGAIKGKWPEVYEDYVSACMSRDNSLGKCVYTQVYTDLWIISAFTQNNYGYDGKVYADPFAVYMAYKELLEMGDIHGLPVYAPKVGCGLGGLNWEKDVIPLLNKYPLEGTINICEFGDK